MQSIIPVSLKSTSAAFVEQSDINARLVLDGEDIQLTAEKVQLWL